MILNEIFHNSRMALYGVFVNHLQVKNYFHCVSNFYYVQVKNISQFKDFSVGYMIL
jgi:hypothetical protein